MIGGQKVVQAFGRQAQSQAVFDGINQKLQACSLRATFFSSITNPATRFVNGLVYAGVAIVGAMVAMGGGITVGRLSTFLSYANQYTKPFNEISGVVTELQNALSCAARVFALIDQQPQVPDAPDARVLENPRGAVELSHVDFSYKPDQRLIEDLNLSVEPGQRIAIVGPTGCGKTTIINLLMRFYDVEDGGVFVDGRDVRSYEKDELHQKFGVVFQNDMVFFNTLRENIRFGRDLDDGALMAAARDAAAEEFITAREEGLDHWAEIGGANLSGGQKQRLLISRALAAHPEILILDDSSSALDYKTDAALRKAIFDHHQNSTTIMVAQRVSSVQAMTNILVMDDGRCIGYGDHAHLLETCPAYREIYETQMGALA